MNKEFNHEEFIKSIIKKYNIPYSVLINKDNTINIEEIKYNNLLKIFDFKPNKCKAWIIDPKTKCKHQCTRRIKHNEFCLVHFQLISKNLLKAGFITKEFIAQIEENQKNLDELEKINKFLLDKKKEKKIKIKVQKITIDSIDYYYEPLSKYIYSIENNQFLGKLNSRGNII